MERFQANLSRLLEEEDQQLTLRILEAVSFVFSSNFQRFITRVCGRQEERRKCVQRDKKKSTAGVEEMKRLNEKSKCVLKREKESLELEKAKRLEMERQVLPEKKQQLEALERELVEAETADRLLEKELEAGRRKLSATRQKLEEQQGKLAQARGRLDQGHRQRDSNQAQKLLQVSYVGPADLLR